MYQGYWLLIKKYPSTSSSNLLASLLIAGLLIVSGVTYPQENLLVSVQKINKEKQKYTGGIKQRFNAWQNLLSTYRNKPLQEKLKATNDFFNQFKFQYEYNYQGVEDYWQTPEEFLVAGAGDCEDFSIAKYFTLLALGVPMSTLRITYVKSIQLNRAHMVLAYYPRPEAEPLILDNLISDILPASKRPDLIPVYGFNGAGLWLAKQRGRDKLLGDPGRLSKWRSVIQRMQGR
ncbi:periplasmic protein [Legionella lansingensis]|uniref:Periplasmic protein n=1 Tax=Legionella lansingensis TaxID=45067 RepID=A0A0W0VZF6_9GAMM|nr:transglutaminase-like cysteine peptidase [Legionella lansingensis]KTD25684.1 periplasmic protein [Legionella lansingensis]SNV49143.1 periplasmic protein [Legionella lansingensis]